RFRRRKRDFPERDAKIGIQFAGDVNPLTVRKLVAEVADCGFARSISSTGIIGARRTAISGYSDAIILRVETHSASASLAATRRSFSFYIARATRFFHKTKSHACSRARLTSPVRHRTLAPFGGITRIRFKGSVAGATLSAFAAPPQYCFSLRIGLAFAKSINCGGDRLGCGR